MLFPFDFRHGCLRRRGRFRIGFYVVVPFGAFRPVCAAVDADLHGIVILLQAVRADPVCLADAHGIVAGNLIDKFDEVIPQIKLDVSGTRFAAAGAFLMVGADALGLAACAVPVAPAIALFAAAGALDPVAADVVQSALRTFPVGMLLFHAVLLWGMVRLSGY